MRQIITIEIELGDIEPTSLQPGDNFTLIADFVHEHFAFGSATLWGRLAGAVPPNPGRTARFP